MCITSLTSLTSQQQSQLLIEKKMIRLNELNPNIFSWTPKLYIENAIGQNGDDKWFTIKTNNIDLLTSSTVKLDICEHRRIKGVFWEKLELNHV
jgi:hypothetical protein